jgi:hypothetical protein
VTSNDPIAQNVATYFSRSGQRKLLEALDALRQFVIGYLALEKTHDIGRAARLTQGTIYNYVRSTEDILFLVCNRLVTEYQDSVRRALVSNGDRTL